MAGTLSADGQYVYYFNPVEYRMALSVYRGMGPYPVLIGEPAGASRGYGSPVPFGQQAAVQGRLAPLPMPMGAETQRAAGAFDPRPASPAFVAGAPTPQVASSYAGVEPAMPQAVTAVGALPPGFAPGQVAMTEGTSEPPAPDVTPPEKAEPFLGSPPSGPAYSGRQRGPSGPSNRINYNLAGVPVFTEGVVDYPLPPAIMEAIRGRRQVPRPPIQAIQIETVDEPWGWPDLDVPGSPGIWRTMGGLPRFAPQSMANLTGSERQALGTLANRTGNRADDFFEQSRKLGNLTTGGAGAYAGAPRRRY